MILTRRTTIKISAELSDLDAGALNRLSLDELSLLVQKLEQETQHLNKIRRLVGVAIDRWAD